MTETRKRVVDLIMLMFFDYINAVCYNPMIWSDISVRHYVHELAEIHCITKEELGCMARNAWKDYVRSSLMDSEIELEEIKDMFFGDVELPSEEE